MEHQYSSDERKNRFASSGADTPRSASQPPTTNGEGFYVSPAMQIYGSPGGRNISTNNNTFNSPWAMSSGRVPQTLSRSSSIGMPASLPRSSSFSASAERAYGSTSFASAIRESHSFPSTFEDDESEALSDATGDYTTDYSYSESRGRNAFLGPDTRSRSQSLATATSMRPGPIGSPPSGWAQGSGPMSIPGRYGYSDVKAPGSRFGSLGNVARSPIGVHGASPSPTGLRVGHGQAELSNISPLARDVGQIMLDEDWSGGDGLDSGATSRRHSVSIVQPRRGIVGFSAPDSQGHDDGTQNFHMGSSAGVTMGNGGSIFSDDEIAVTLNNLSLSQQNQPSRSSQPVSQPSSLPIYAPLSRSSHDTLSGSLAESLSIPSGEHLPRRMLRTPSESGYSVGSSGASPPRGLEHSPALDQYTSRTQPSRPEIRTDLSPSMQNLRFNGMQYNIPENGPAPQMSPTFMRNTIASNQPFIQMHQGQMPLSPTRHMDNQLQMQHILQQQQQQHAGVATPLQRRASQSESLHQHSLSSPSAQVPGQSQLSDLGRGIPLHAVPTHWALYIVEFKAGRTDLYYNDDPRMPQLRVNDLVIVEADRGKDLGKIVNDTITAAEVEAFVRQQAVQAQQAALMEQGYGGGGPTSPDGHVSHGKKEINPKKIYGKANAQDAQQLIAKRQDEEKALQLCKTKVRQKKLPMEVVDAEYQWDRRKLTFFFVAEKRIDFRELVRELFRLYKTRIWMASIGGQMSPE